jgi:hypothetical protein
MTLPLGSFRLTDLEPNSQPGQESRGVTDDLYAAGFLRLRGLDSLFRFGDPFPSRSRLGRGWGGVFSSRSKSWSRS